MVFIILTNINKNKAIPKHGAPSPARPPFSCHFGSRGSGDGAAQVPKQGRNLRRIFASHPLPVAQVSALKEAAEKVPCIN